MGTELRKFNDSFFNKPTSQLQLRRTEQFLALTKKWIERLVKSKKFFLKTWYLQDCPKMCLSKIDLLIVNLIATLIMNLIRE